MDRLEKLNQYLLANPNDPFTRHALALEWVKRGEDGLARAAFEALLALSPDYVGSYYHLGKLLERTGDRSEALRVYHEGIQRALDAGDSHAARELRSAADALED